VQRLVKAAFWERTDRFHESGLSRLALLTHLAGVKYAPVRAWLEAEVERRRRPPHD
jgi:hypothetical protein